MTCFSSCLAALRGLVRGMTCFSSQRHDMLQLVHAWLRSAGSRSHEPSSFFLIRRSQYCVLVTVSTAGCEQRNAAYSTCLYGCTYLVHTHSAMPHMLRNSGCVCSFSSHIYSFTSPVYVGLLGAYMQCNAVCILRNSGCSYQWLSGALIIGSLVEP